MPITPTYPGVYIEEIPSGVRTITGVSTSVTAFIGAAKRGSINKAVRILSYSDYEREFGGLDADSEISYALRQFFLNGGSDAWVVRLAKDTSFATATLTDALSRPSLTITALNEGKAGNNIEVRVDDQTSNPASSFNLAINYISPDNPQDNSREKFESLSLNSKDPRYVLDIVNGISQLVKVERVANLTNISSLKGTSVSGELVDGSGVLVDVSQLRDATHDRFRVSVNGAPPVEVIITAANVSGANNIARLNTLCAAIQATVSAVHSGFICSADGNRIRMISGTGGETSSVRVLPGLGNDISARLKLGTLNGGIETDAVAAIRPIVQLDRATLTSGAITSIGAIPDATNNSLQIGLDGESATTISLGNTAATGSTLAAKLTNIAARIQTAVRAIKPAYKDFTCFVTTSTNTAGDIATTQYKLVLASGTKGAGSAIVVTAAAANDIATELQLVGLTATTAANLMLQGGSESPFTEAEAYNLLFGNPSERKGIYALEGVDLFNLLCLPGMTESSILTDAAAYCQQRRAFLIADAPKNADKPDEMAQVISSTALPKTEYGAVYYPWIYTADPLNNGKLRLCPPSGTIAGLYARTDSNRGVWKAPAGTEANLVGVQKVDYLLTDNENGTLNPLGVNCIRIFPVYGAVAWGARTLRGADQLTSEYKYIPVRRLVLYIEESLYRGTKWVVFEPNDEPLWSQIRLNIGAFMNNLFRQGAFQGKTPREAYFVKCDRETTTQNDINLGIVNILVGFAPLKPAEFVIIKIQQMAGQIVT
jgi:phage tail sheath protein FI